MEHLLHVRNLQEGIVPFNLVHAFQYSHKDDEIRNYVAEARSLRFQKEGVYGTAYLRALKADRKKGDQFYFLGQGIRWHCEDEKNNAEYESLLTKVLGLNEAELLWKIRSNGFSVKSRFLCEDIGANYRDNIAVRAVAPVRMKLTDELLQFAFAPIDQAVAQLYQMAKSMNFGEEGK